MARGGFVFEGDGYDDPLTCDSECLRDHGFADRVVDVLEEMNPDDAADLLAQGAGRLIRRTSDRGVVAVLDPRLRTARYGSYLRASMPGFWSTTDREVAINALRRLAEG